jgi:hypothetical protein
VSPAGYMRRGALGLLLLAASAASSPASPQAGAAAALHARHVQLQPALQASPFGKPLVIESREDAGTLMGEVHAVLSHPYERLRQSLAQPPRWCDIFILPFNTKYCHAVWTAERTPALLVRIGRRHDQPVEQAFSLRFDFQEVDSSPDHFEARLAAAQGPVGTRDLRISVAAVPLAGGQTFLRLSYSYGAGFMGRMAMQAYLATSGANMVGFTRVPGPGGTDALIGGMRGAVERNAMRYYLAVDAFLDSLQAPPAQQAEYRIQAWFDATERYPRQLREMDRQTYVAMKRHEVERQQVLLP